MTLVDHSGHVVIVTGAGRGLGRAHARSLSGRGASVVVNDLVPEHAEAVVAEIEKDGGTAVVSSDSCAMQTSRNRHPARSPHSSACTSQDRSS
jgi:NAD(P)-dependent dehydrogenase (short-subunit alcohol dehydrogenase family)